MKVDAPQLPVDPNLEAEKQQAQDALIGSLQTKSQGDMAGLMARYGTHLAMAGANYGPMTSPRPLAGTTAIRI